MDAFIVVLREAFEASLLVALLLAIINRRDDRQHYREALVMGIMAAVATSLLAGAFLYLTLGGLSGRAEQLFEGGAMLLAAAVLTWMVFWMRRQALQRSQLEARTEVALARGHLALGLVAFLLVVREGLEASLFVAVVSQRDSLIFTVLGAGLGLAIALAMGVALYRGATCLDLRRFFLISGLLVIALAAYLLVAGLEELAEAGAGAFLADVAIPLAVVLAGGLSWSYLRETYRRR